MLGVDGNVYCIPCDAPEVLVIHPPTRSLQVLGDLPDTKKKFQGGAAAPDGTIWGLPESCEHILRIDVLGAGAASVERQLASSQLLWEDHSSKEQRPASSHPSKERHVERDHSSKARRLKSKAVAATVPSWITITPTSGSTVKVECAFQTAKKRQ